MTDLQDDANMTLDERMAYLRTRGIEISTPEERKAAAIANPQADGQTPDPSLPPVAYVLLPADSSQPIQELSFASPRLGEGGMSTSDPLADHLKSAFRGHSDRVDLSLLQKGGGNAAHILGSAGAPTKVSDDALRQVAAQGNVEIFTLVHGCAANKYTSINIYLDEAGMLKRLPLNPRATDYAKRAGFNPPPQFYGDVFLGRIQSKPSVRHLPFVVGEDTAMDAPWLQKATTENLEYQLAMNRLTGQNETQPDVVGQDGKEKLEEGYSWTQTEEEIEIIISLPADATPKDIHVKFSPQMIKVDFQKSTKSVLKLFHGIDVDSGTWVLEKGPDKRKLLVTAEKAEEGFWPRMED